MQALVKHNEDEMSVMFQRAIRDLQNGFAFTEDPG